MRGLWIAFAVVVFSGLEAHAGPLPDATYSVTFNNGTPITAPGSYSTPGGEVGEVLTSPQPSAHARVAGVGTSVVQMTYWFRVDGPANTQVPVQIAGRVAINAGGAVFLKDYVWGVTAQLIAQSFDGPLGPGVGQIDSKFATVDCSPTSVGNVPVSPPIPSCSAVSQDENVTLSLTALTGADNHVVLNAAANNQESFFANFDSLVDPVISFAPGFDSTGFTIVLSDGVGNTVPEPSSPWCLALLPLVARLRRARATPR